MNTTLDQQHQAAIQAYRTGALAEAAERCQQLLQQAPDHAPFWNTQAVVLKAMGRLDEAEQAYRRALALSPQYLDAWRNLGHLLAQQQRWQPALEAYRTARQLQPQDLPAWLGAVEALQALRQGREALQEVQACLQLLPEAAEAQAKAGALQLSRHRYAEALVHFEAAARLQPTEPRHALNLALVLRTLERPDEAERQLQALGGGGTEPAMAQVLRLQIALDRYGAPQRRMAQPDDVLQAIDRLRAWARAAPGRALALREAAAQFVPFKLAYRPGPQLPLIAAYGALVRELVLACGPEPAPARPLEPRPTLAVVSTHVCRHSVWDIVLKGLIAHLDRSRFRVVLFNLGPQSDAETLWAQQQVDAYIDLQTQASDVAACCAAVRAVAPQLLLYPELGMNGVSYWMAAHRLAPVQAVAWGHPLSSGLPTVDLYFSGAALEPEPAQQAQQAYCERLVRLPGTGCVTAWTEPDGTAAAAAPFELPGPWSGPSFLLPHAPFKLAEEGDAVVLAIARQAPAARFLFMADPLMAGPTEATLARLRAGFEAEALPTQGRLLALPWQKPEAFTALLEAADVYLDWPSFSGYTTARRALHQGMPLVCLEGPELRQRLAAGLLRHSGAEPGPCASVADYAQLALALAAEAQQPAARQARRRQLRARAQRAEGQLEVVRAFEDALTEALQRAAAALPSASISAAQDPPMTEPSAPYPWQLLDQELHLHTLRPDYAPQGLLAMIERPPRLVLDVGCFCGGSGRWIQQRFPGCRVVGIEPMARAAERAREAYEAVETLTVEQLPTDWGLEAGVGRFDVIVLADVLEHLVNPWRVLQKLRPWLKPGGILLVSLPNARNLQVLGGLAAGRWRYTGAGVLDVSHLRFFTRQEAAEMLGQTGWQIQHTTLNLDPALRELYRAYQQDPTRPFRVGPMSLSGLSPLDAQELCAIQLFFRAQPAATPAN